MSTKEMPTGEAIEAGSIREAAVESTALKHDAVLDIEGPTMADLRNQRQELARDFVTLKHTISQLRADRDRLSVENRDLKMRLAAIETDYANLFSYVEGRQAEA